MSRKLKKHSYTTSEDILWQKLRNKQLCNVRFRRQHSVGVYTVDFFSFSKKLAVEIDGLIHKSCRIQDKKREQYLLQRGISTLRFPNWMIHNDIDKVTKQIQSALRQK
ncbi:endonuclease domain-containing protein [Candidatus Uabimicrobium sp. HlEnr_7]|uniref:endonuclease domain-containing protein n=1 Tax=Candidatus Uabimicrobium helgolandensis TaxID=3095367 RepID=UPI0035561786